MTNVTHYFFRSSVNSGVIGVLVGIMASGAANIKDYRKGIGVKYAWDAGVERLEDKSS